MKVLLSILFLGSLLFSNALEVTTSIIPQKYMIEKIAGDKVKVNVMVRKGFSPATYEPKTSQMKKLAKSKIYFSIGVPFENVWLKKFQSANSSMNIVDTSNGIKKLKMVAHVHHDEHDEHKEEKHDDHGHEKHDDHDEHKDEKHEEQAGHEHEGGLDPHIWLDPVLVKVQAKNIYEALVKIDANNAKIYHSNYEKFVKELDTLHHELEEKLESLHGKAFMVFHPSWGYFAKRYELEQISVEKEGKEPKPKELVELISEAKLHDIRVVFVAPQFSQKSAKIIAKSINGKVAFLDPLEEDYKKNLLKVAEVIKQSYK